MEHRKEIPKNIVLDTSVMVAHLRGGRKESGLITWLQQDYRLATTIVNAFELYYGAYRSANIKINLAATKGFLETIEILQLDERSAERSGKVMADLESAGKGVNPRDVFTGCIALESGYAVLTSNLRHFDCIPDLVVLSVADTSA